MNLKKGDNEHILPVFLTRWPCNSYSKGDTNYLQYTLLVLINKKRDPEDKHAKCCPNWQGSPCCAAVVILMPANLGNVSGVNRHAADSRVTALVLLATLLRTY